LGEGAGGWWSRITQGYRGVELGADGMAHEGALRRFSGARKVFDEKFQTRAGTCAQREGGGGLPLVSRSEREVQGTVEVDGPACMSSSTSEEDAAIFVSKLLPHACLGLSLPLTTKSKQPTMVL
jgi:hypothetical protein